MLATSLTAAVVGAEAHLIRVEADTSSGFPRFTMLGLPDSSIKESEGRIRAALRNCGYAFKWDRRITVSMAPASLRKMGSSYDLATAVGLLAADGALAPPRLADVLLVGELALDGTVRPVSGVLPMMLMARRNGLRAARSSPPPTPRRRRWSKASTSIPSRRCRRRWISPPRMSGPRPPRAAPAAPAPVAALPDMADVRGQALARRALEIAAAGGHNLLFVGPPGSGKTMLARRLPGLLPRLSLDEALETSAIHSAAGARLDVLLAERPFRAPASHGQRRRDRRRRLATPAGRGEPRAQRRAVPRRAARVPAQRARGAAPAARGTHGHHRPRPRHAASAGALPARSRP